MEGSIVWVVTFTEFVDDNKLVGWKSSNIAEQGVFSSVELALNYVARRLKKFVENIYSQYYSPEDFSSANPYYFNFEEDGTLKEEMDVFKIYKAMNKGEYAPTIFDYTVSEIKMDK